MHPSADKESNRSENHPGKLVATTGDGSPGQDARQRSQASNETQSVPDAVAGFIERNPVIAAGAALAVGAAVVMMVQSRRAASNRVDRRVQRAVRSMDRTFSREMKALRRSDMADRLGQFGSSLGDAFSRIDLNPIAERGREYLDEARRRLRA